MIHVFIGWDPRDDLAAKVAVRSLKAHSTEEVEITLLKEWELRRMNLYWRSYTVERNGQMVDDLDGKPFSTQFAFSRFLVAEIARRRGIESPVIFMDADVMLRADIRGLYALWDRDKAAMCVQHIHEPEEGEKMDGVRQTRYFRKNWSSVMMVHPDKCPLLSRFAVNNRPGSHLHGFLWTEDHLIGSLPVEWNYLVNITDPADVPDPKLVHFTLGTPDMPGHESDDYAAEWRSYLKPDEQGDLI